MQLTIRFETLLKRATGLATQTLVLDEPCDVRDVVKQLAEEVSEPARQMLLNSSGQLQPSLMLFVNDQQIVGDMEHSVCDGDDITLMTPISGG